MTRAFRIPFGMDELLAESRRIANVALDDPDVHAPLQVLLDSLNEEGGLHESGAVAKQHKLLRLLANRLRMQRDFAAHPEIADEEIRAPLMVVGMARSGTTKLQKSLATSGDFNWLPFWQTYNPALFSGDRNESTGARVRAAELYCEWFDRESPGTKLGHSFEAHEPEEDTTLTEGSFVAVSFMGYAEVPSYVAWLAGQDMGTHLRFLRDTLKYLQWQGLADRSKRWLLKAPTYYGIEPDLAKVFPGARIVMTHRSPLDTVPSSCKLIQEFHRPFSAKRPDPLLMLAGFRTMMERHVANRAGLSGLHILDVHFDDLNRSVEEAVRRIYTWIDLPLGERAMRAIREWERRNPRHGRGRFEYSLEEFGLTQRQISGELAVYIDLMDRLFGKRG
jgi:hypothetical protein